MTAEPQVDAVRSSEAPGTPLRVLSTLNEDGSRRWILPILSHGRYLTRRRYAAWFLILLFAALPVVNISGKPAVLLDVAKREFTFFGATFYPTDTVLLTLFLLSVFVAIFLITALYGRVWCGWACPQTVYMEFVFRPIERLFDGPPGRFGKTSRRPNAIRSVLKFVTYFLVSALLANTFLAYFVGAEELWRWMRRSPFDHPGGFLIMAATTGLMLFDFAWFREQTCILACPYGRLQSVLFDKQTMIVGYDAARGEPRHRGRAAPAGSTGDCVDCGLCVVTCPTGIDIRNGLQLECVGCTQCIDACDAVMDKIGRRRGLIRYGSQAEFAGSPRRLMRPRVVIYYTILAVLLGALAVLLLTSHEADVMLTRGPGLPFVELPDGRIANTVRLKITNRAAEARHYRITLADDLDWAIDIPDNNLTIATGRSLTTSLRIIAPREAFAGGSVPVRLLVRDEANFSELVTYQLLGPLHREHDAEAGGR